MTSRALAGLLLLACPVLLSLRLPCPVRGLGRRDRAEEPARQGRNRANHRAPASEASLEGLVATVAGRTGR